MVSLKTHHCMLEKKARRRALDATQEALRQSKDLWNAEVSKLIGELIALKRGINGRGDRDFGLPPSSINYPFPQEIDQFLSGTSSHSSRIFEFGRRILDQQENYAKGRNKIASWWGSQFYSRFDLWRKADKKERDLRRRIITSVVAIDKKIKKFEYHILDYRNPLSVPFAISALTDIIENFVAEILPQFLLLRNLLEAINNSKKDDHDSLQKSTEVPKINENKLDNQASISIDDIKNNGAAISALVLGSKEKLSEEDKKTLEKLYDEFSKSLAIFVSFDLNSSLRDKIDEESLKNKIKTLYKEMFVFFEKIYGTTSKPYDISEFMHKISNDKIKNGIQVYELYLKQASFSLSRIFNEKILSLSKQPINKLKLDLVDITSKCRDYLDKLLDLLEKKESSVDSMNNQCHQVIQNFYTAADRMDDIAKIFNQEIRRQIREKHHYIKDIKESDIRQLLKAKEKLVPYLFEVW